MLYQLLTNPNQASNKKGSNLSARKGLTNILENENDWTLEILAPGYHKSDFTMKIEDNTLHVSSPAKSEKRKFFRKEYRTSEIDRSFTLPKNIDSENISANLDAGILSIVIPKSEEAKPRTINIK